jgi:tRNA A-37 threonylcarbamoyl transferase component Bud32
MELLNQSQIRERVEELTERAHPGKIRVFSDTSDFMDISAGDVIHVGGGYYYVYGEEVEGRFGLDDQPKFWVKRARDLETGQRKIIKLAFFESFTMNLGDIRVECFRSPRKEARILRKTSDDEAFMKGIAAEDDAGNVVRILDRINGISIYSYLQGHKSPHEKFFHEEFPRLFPSVLSSVRAVERLHAAGEVHGDIRNDHLWLDRDSGGWRWIDFDYAYEWTENPFGVDLYGLGNILLFTAGNGFFNLKDFDACLPAEVPGSVCLEPEDFSLFFAHRIMNLRKLFPYVPESLNRVLMRFSHKVEVLYGDIGEMVADLEECRSDLGIRDEA